VFLMSRRARARRRDFDDRHPDELDRLSCPGHEHACLMRNRLERSLAVLTPGTRRAVVLHHGFGLTFDEVGRVLGIREAAAKLRNSRGVATARRRFGSGVP
jgi:DNA-directed RNA polymerase specialized sigma24 family protein